MTYSLSLKKLNLQVLQMATQYMWQSRFDRNFTIRIWFKTNDMIVNQINFDQWVINFNQKFQERPKQMCIKHKWLYLTMESQKQPSRGVLSKMCSENMQQIYRRTPMPECDFNKVALRLYWNHTLAWVFSCKFAGYFQNTFY